MSNPCPMGTGASGGVSSKGNGSEASKMEENSTHLLFLPSDRSHFVHQKLMLHRD